MQQAVLECKEPLDLALLEQLEQQEQMEDKAQPVLMEFRALLAQDLLARLARKD